LKWPTSRKELRFSLPSAPSATPSSREVPTSRAPTSTAFSAVPPARPRTTPTLLPTSTEELPGARIPFSNICSTPRNTFPELRWFSPALRRRLSART
ncbi:unnamed protein product, partial [Ectocarpus fasciculatus]